MNNQKEGNEWKNVVDLKKIKKLNTSDSEKSNEPLGTIM